MIILEPSDTKIRLETVKIINRLKESKKAIGIIGNGGSLAEADHFAGELIPYDIPAISFSSSAVLTAVGNDLEFIQVFNRQVLTFRYLIDTLFILTTSGKSENLKGAYYTALKYNINVVFLTGTTYPAFAVASDLIYNPLVKLIQFEGSTGEIQEKTLHFIHQFYEEVKLWDTLPSSSKEKSQ